MTEMEKIIEKRIYKEAHPNAFLTWWKKNSYKVFRVIFFPVWLCVFLNLKWKEYQNKRTEYSNETAKAFLDYYLPRVCDFDNGAMWYNVNWWKHEKSVPRKYKTFVSRYWRDIIRYLVDEYQILGYKKSLEDWDEWVKFEKEG